MEENEILKNAKKILLDKLDSMTQTELPDEDSKTFESVTKSLYYVKSMLKE